MSADDFASIVARARDGDPAAQAEICRRYGERVRGAIRGRLGRDLHPRVDTDDVFQTAFVASLAGLRDADFSGEAPFVAWLAQVAERRLLDEARHHRAARRDVARQRPLAAAAALASVQTSPTRGAVRSETRHAVQSAVARLPDPERRVVELHALGGKRFSDVAAELGLAGPDEARTVFRRALRRMGDLLEEPGGAG